MSVGTSTEIRLAARKALAATGGWGASIGGWVAWIAVEFCVNHLLGGLAAPLAVGGGSGLTMLALSAVATVAVFYYFTFVKVYGLSALAVSVMRGAPAFRYAFSGFGRGWHSVGVHLWIGWCLFVPALPWLLPLLGFCAWTCAVPERSAAAVRAAAAYLDAQPYMVCACAAVVVGVLLTPTIAAWYRYRLAYMVLIDHPDRACRAIVDESARLMEGRRSTMFRLDLWFIGVTALLYLPGCVSILRGIRGLDAVAMQNMANCMLKGNVEDAVQTLQSIDPGALGLVLGGAFMVSVAGFVLTLWLNPYWTAARAAFYETVLDLVEGQTPPPLREDGQLEVP